MAKKKDISAPKVGMNRAMSPHLLSEGEFSFQKNGNSYDEGGEKFNLTDEHSNILATRFKSGFKFIGGRNHVVRDTTYIFLHNPTSGVSEIGIIKNTRDFSVESDTEAVSNCEGCDELINEEATPLENQAQTPHQLYETLLEDSCNLCLGFDLDHPIMDIIIKEENIGTTLWWTPTPGNKEFRYLELDNLEQYKITGDDNCGNIPTDTCLDCDKLRVFKLYSELKVDRYERTVGGNLKKGSYEILGAYCDQLGNEFTSYTQLTPTIPIFDEANVIHEQEDNDAETNFAIKLEMATIDTNFDFYKIAVRYYTSKGVFVSFEEEIHGTSDRIIVLSDNNGISISNTALALKKPFIESVDGISASNNILILNGLREREPINLQPVISLAGLGIQWMSFRAKEDLYKNADSYKYIGYNRDENVALSVDFGFKDGSRTNNYVFIPRPPTAEEISLFNSGNDFDSITSIVGDCDGNLRNKKWQFYNTATEVGSCPLDQGIDTVIQTESVVSYTEVFVDPIPQGVISVDPVFIDEFTTLENYLESNQQTCTIPPYEGSPIELLCQYLDKANLTGFNNLPEIEGDCTEPNLIDESVVEGKRVKDDQIHVGRKLVDYSRVRPPNNCNIYEIDPGGDNPDGLDPDFSAQYLLNASNPVPEWNGTVKKRVNPTHSTTCQSGLELFLIDSSNITGGFSQSFSHPYYGIERNISGATVEDDLAEGLETKNALYTATYPISEVGGVALLNGGSGVFTNKIHKGAIWYKINVKNKSNLLVEISRLVDVNANGPRLGPGYNRFKNKHIRVHFFPNCSTVNPFEESSYKDEDGLEVFNATSAPTFGGIYRLNSAPTLIPIDESIMNSPQISDGFIYMVVDLPFTATLGLGQDNFIGDEPQPPIIDTAITMVLNSCFTVNLREIEFSDIKITFDEIVLKKRQKYASVCNYEVPVLKDCEPVPFKYGDMGYYESTEKYPDNKELYDSTSLTVRRSKITNSEFLNKLQAYSDNTSSEIIQLSDNADFRCKNIRAYKLPDNKISPFINTQQIASNSDSIISPLGFTISGEVIRNLLDVAVDSGLISQDKRDDIVDYKIYRADSTLDRSVVASGLAFNTKSYTVDQEEVNYFNYPFNSLGYDKYFPDNEDGIFDKMQAISPEFDYFRPSLPSEMSLQGFIFGKSHSRVLPVKDHAKMVILGDKARKLANTLAKLEVAAEITVQSMQALSNAQVQIGFVVNVGIPAFAASIVIAAIGIVEGLVGKVARYRTQWEKSFEDLGTPYNFGYYTSSGSKYNYMSTLQEDGNRIRGLAVKKYLKSGMLNVSDNISGKVIKINNIDREESTFFTLGDYPIEDLNEDYTSFDNSDLNPAFSSQLLSSEMGCDKGKSSEQLRNVASPYVAFKNYIPNQYGTIDSIKWIDTTYCLPIDTTGVCNGILGGDTFISRHSKKRKARIFETDLLGSADNTPFPYRVNSNYGDPRFYIDYKINSEFQSGNKLFPTIFYDVEFDCDTDSSGFYIEPPGKFYLYSIAFTNFLCETRINTNFRNARKEPWNQFYPQNTDYEQITQPTTVSLTRTENFFYNRAYLQTNVQNTAFTLPEYYSSENEVKKAYNINSGMYSLPDVNENSITEPWLMYRPNDKFTLESRYGNLIGMKGAESGQIIMYFEDATQIQNAKNPFTDGSTEYSAELGNGGMFAKRAITLRSTDIGYGGSQSKNVLSCEFGHFHADMKRGQVFRVMAAGEASEIEEVSRYSNGKPNGMDVWFKEHLPLKFSKRFPDYPTGDNPYNGIGVHWGYDSKYRRIILTKKDYIPKTGQNISYDKDNNTFDGLTFREQVVAGNFKEISWTITYKPETGSWESYMSYTPNYYINHTDYFQSGLNTDDSTFGLWSHLLSNKSYRVFYGQKFPYIFEYPVKNEYISKRLEALSWNAQLRRYHNEYDFATIEANPFTAVTIYNNYENSGRLIPVLNNGTLSQLSKYPITNTQDNTQEVLLSYDNYRYNMDYFYNRVKSNRNNQPVWLWDENQIDKTLNPKAVSFLGKSTLERLKGNFFIVRLERDGNTNHDLDFRWSEQTTNPII